MQNTVSEELNKRIDETLSNWKTPFDDKEKSWEAIQSKISSNESTPVVRMWPKWVAAAASVALLVGAFYFFNSPTTVSHLTAQAQHEQITLPDGSIVQLNADSRIDYNKDWKSSRELHLDGEAFFSVKKGSRFSVVTSNGIVEVLGTSFNVFNRGESFEVACETGKVKVSDADESVILVPGSATHSSDKKLMTPYARNNSNGWIMGELDYDNEAVTAVFDELERQFAITIDYRGDAQALFSGPVILEDLETALTTVCVAQGFDYVISGDGQVTITQN